MKSLNSFRYILLLAFTFAMTLTMISCNTDDDNNPSPVPDVRNKFIGDWNVVDGCSKGNYVVNISKDPSNTSRVLLSNFANSNGSRPDTALVVSNSVILHTQTNSEGWVVAGTGEYNVEGKIQWVFSLTISGYQENCTATYSK